MGRKKKETISVAVVTRFIDNSQLIVDLLKAEYNKKVVVACFYDGEALTEYESGQVWDCIFLGLEFEKFASYADIQLVCEKYTNSHIVVFTEEISVLIYHDMTEIGVNLCCSLPVRHSHVRGVIDKLLVKKEERKRKEKEKNIQMEQMMQAKYALEESFIHTILFYRRDRRLLQAYSKALGLGKQGCVVIMEMPMQIIGDEKRWEVYSKIKFWIREALGLDSPVIAGETGKNRCVVYISGSKKQKELLQQEYLEEIITNQLQLLNEKIKLYVGGWHSVENVFRSYQEALQEGYMEGKVADASKQNINLSGNHKEFRKQIEILKDSLRMKKYGSMEIFCKILREIRPLEKEVRVSKIMQILMLCCHAVYVDGKIELELMDFQKMVKEAVLLREDEIESWALNQFNAIEEAMQEREESTTSKAVRRGISYLEKNYQNEVSQEDVAQYVGMSPQHFSKIFKQETGKNYIEWITHLRMEQAKLYLVEGNYSVKEVCFLVGYKDPNYFSRLFKKEIGMSPKAYSQWHENV